MSDTPRTDEQINGKPATRFEILAGDSLRNASVPAEFARGLERELNIELERANYYRDKWQRNEQRIKQLEGGDAALSYSIGLDLQKENDALNQRIKGLEEAGDEAMYPIEYAARVRIWTKAKEAKP